MTLDIYFKTKNLRDSCLLKKDAIRRWGHPLALRIMQRIKELEAASSLAQISHLPPLRLHGLVNNRDGQFAISVNDRIRMIFIPFNDPVPRLPDGNVDKTQVSKILILEVTDYHDD